MTQQPDELYDAVGPVLESGEIADAIIRAIKKVNTRVSVTNRGAYVRVSVPTCCRVGLRDIEESLGRSFHLPGDLELVMPSFKGTLTIRSDEIEWSFGARP